MLSLHPRWPKIAPRSDPNPIQVDPNPIQSDPIRSNPIQIRIRIGPWPPQVGSGSVLGHSRSDPDGHAKSGLSGNHAKSSERKPTGLSIVQSKCVVLLYLSIYMSRRPDLGRQNGQGGNPGVDPSLDPPQRNASQPGLKRFVSLH